MNYECIVERGVNGYYLVFVDGEKKSLSSVRPFLSSENGIKLESDRFIMYSIDGIDESGKECKYNLRVKKGLENRYSEFIEDFDSRCAKPIKVKKINWKRLAIIAFSCVLAVSTPAVIKGAKNALNEDYEDWKNRNSAPEYTYDNPSLNPELSDYDEYVRKIQKEESLDEEYSMLLLRALNGDKDALGVLREQALSGNEIAKKVLVDYLFETSKELNSKTR